MSRWAIALTALVAWLGACAGGPMTPAEAELDRALTIAGSGALAGGTRLKKFDGRAIRGETEHGFIAMLDADTCYAIVGVSAAGVREMLLSVAAPSGAQAGRTRARGVSASIGVCARMSGPYRIALELAGRGDFAIGVFGPAPPAEGAPSAAPVALGPAPSLPTLAPPSAPSAPSAPAADRAPPAAVCATVGSLEPFHRVLLGADRSCKADADCIAIKLDCSQLSCGGVHRGRRAAYATPIDCRGYAGPVGNHDCDPQLGIEAPRCAEGCCVSARVAP